MQGMNVAEVVVPLVGGDMTKLLLEEGAMEVEGDMTKLLLVGVDMTAEGVDTKVGGVDMKVAGVGMKVEEGDMVEGHAEELLVGAEVTEQRQQIPWAYGSI